MGSNTSSHHVVLFYKGKGISPRCENWTLREWGSVVPFWWQEIGLASFFERQNGKANVLWLILYYCQLLGYCRNRYHETVALADVLPTVFPQLITAKVAPLNSSMPSSPDSSSDSSTGSTPAACDGPNIEAEKCLPGVVSVSLCLVCPGWGICFRFIEKDRWFSILL